MDLSLGIAVGQSFGRTVTAELIALREQGYIREHVGRRHDGTPPQLYTITTKVLAPVQSWLSSTSARTHHEF